MQIHYVHRKTYEMESGQKGGGHPAVYSRDAIGFQVQVFTTTRRSHQNINRFEEHNPCCLFHAANIAHERVKKHKNTFVRTR